MKARNLRAVVAMACTLLLSLCVLVGCAQQKQEGPDYKDQEFLADLAKGLEKRWDLSDKFEKENQSIAVTAEQFEQLVQTELDAIEKYAEEKFEDKELQELAISYINVLNDQYEAADVYAAAQSTTDITTINKWNSVYNERVIILQQLLEDYEVKTNEKYAATRSTLTSAGKAAKQTADVNEALQAIGDNTEFKFKDDGYGNISGKAQMENTTGMDFVHVQFDVQLYDKEGVRTDTTYASLENWKDGEKVNVQVYVSSGEMPESVKLVPSYYELLN